MAYKTTFYAFSWLIPKPGAPCDAPDGVCGEGGIRTHECLATLLDYRSSALSHSATSVIPFIQRKNEIAFYLFVGALS